MDKTYIWRDTHRDIYTRRDIHGGVYTWWDLHTEGTHTEGAYTRRRHNKHTETYTEGTYMEGIYTEGPYTWRNKHTERHIHGGVYAGWRVYTVTTYGYTRQGHGGDIRTEGVNTWWNKHAENLINVWEKDWLYGEGVYVDEKWKMRNYTEYILSTMYVTAAWLIWYTHVKLEHTSGS